MLKLRDFKRIIIFQYGKVGSSTMRDTLRQYHNDVHHVHHLNESSNSHLLKKKKILIINIVRNMYDRNISNLFQNMSNKGTDFYYCEQKKRKKIKINQLIKHYRNANVKHTNKLLIPWFQKFKQNIGVDIFSQKFNRKKRYNIYRSDDKTILTVRFEDIGHWNTILTDLFGEKIKIKDSNVTKSKLYIKFKRDYKYTQKEFKTIQKVDHLSHFYTKKEINGFKSKYK